MVLKLLMLLVVVDSSVAQNANGECRYYYFSEPKNILTCNPYTSGHLIINCEMRYASSERSIGSLMWVFESAESGSRRSLESASEKYSIVSSTTPTSSITQLRINHLDSSDVGRYYCQGCFRNGTLLSSSEKLTLHPRADYFDASFLPCAPQEQSNKHSIRCASETANVAVGCEVFVETNASTTQPTTELPITSSNDVVLSTTETPLLSTHKTSPTTLPATAAENDPPLTTTPSKEELQDGTTKNPAIISLDNVGSSRRRLDESAVLLYSVISVVVLFVLIFIILLLGAGLCYYIC